METWPAISNGSRDEDGFHFLKEEAPIVVLGAPMVV